MESVLVSAGCVDYVCLGAGARAEVRNKSSDLATSLSPLLSLRSTVMPTKMNLILIEMDTKEEIGAKSVFHFLCGA